LRLGVPTNFSTALRLGVPTNFSTAKIFGSHMVIQHDQPAPVWGFDVPGSKVTVSIRGGSSWSNITDATGLWKVTLDAHGMGGPHGLDVTSSSGGAAALEDVYFGSVYVCGGQSNMQFSLHGAFNASEACVIAPPCASP
jgi:sialate O-acetylesterase